MCVSCFDTSEVRIRSQTNGLPSHCYGSPKDVPAEVEFDWTVNWMHDVTNMDTVPEAVNNQEDLNDLICNIMRSKDDNIPSECNYKKKGGDTMNTAWGFATTGMMFFSGLSAEGVDPFYPAVYADVYEPSLFTLLPFVYDTEDVEKVDWCLGHPQVAGLMHYHSAPTCRADATYINDKSGAMDRDLIEITKEVYAASLKYRSVLGVSKDGRPIYTPLYDNGKEYADCDVDICNGIMIGGHYSYVSTLFHPYIMGCFGPGSSPELYQQCSTNPRLCNVQYADAKWGMTLSATATAAMIAINMF